MSMKSYAYFGRSLLLLMGKKNYFLYSSTRRTMDDVTLWSGRGFDCMICPQWSTEGILQEVQVPRHEFLFFVRGTASESHKHSHVSIVRGATIIFVYFSVQMTEILLLLKRKFGRGLAQVLS